MSTGMTKSCPFRLSPSFRRKVPGIAADCQQLLAMRLQFGHDAENALGELGVDLGSLPPREDGPHRRPISEGVRALQNGLFNHAQRCSLRQKIRRPDRQFDRIAREVIRMKQLDNLEQCQ